MKTAGCDVGSLTAKAVILDNGKVVGKAVAKSRANPEASAKRVMDQALEDAGLNMEEISRCVGTGYGRERIPFVHDTRSEIACHARGAHHLMPSVRTVIDIGGQDCKAIKLSDKGEVEHFITNDKCAAGTGRFLEVMADVLNLSLDELGPLARKGKSPITLASNCTVWAQADVIRHVNDKIPLPDIASGVCAAMAQRMAILVNNLGVRKELCMTGGVAKNIGVVKALETQLGVKLKTIRNADPQLTGALGAALIAWDSLPPAARG